MYPISYKFKRIALANKVTVTSADGHVMLYAHQKMLKLKEKILVYADESTTALIGELNADRVIDFSPLMTFTNAAGQALFSVKRKGRQSIWRAHYEILTMQGEILYTITEDNVWAKVGNALFAELPMVGMLAGYVFNPRYKVLDPNGQTIGMIDKKPSLMESWYEFSCQNPEQTDPNHILPTAIFAVLTRERMRG